MQTTYQSIIETRERILKILWFALLMSCCVLTGVSFQLAKGRAELAAITGEGIAPTASDFFGHFMTLPFLAIAIAALGASFLLPKILGAKTATNLNHQSLLQDLEDQTTSKGGRIWSREELEIAKTLSMDQLQKMHSISKKFTLFILALALSEVPTIFGMILVMQTGYFPGIFLFFGLSLAGFLARYPDHKLS